MRSTHRGPSLFRLSRLFGWSLALCGLLLTACYGEPQISKQIGSLTVTFAEGTKLGSKTEPLEVPHNPQKYEVTVVAQKPDGSVDTDFNGEVCLYSNKGILIGNVKPLKLTNGKLEKHAFTLKLAFGRTTIWASEASPDGSKVDKCPNSSDPNDTTAPYIGRVGAAPDLTFKNLSIVDVQDSDISPYDSPLFKKYALISQGRMVVTAVTSNGFHATDIDAYKAGRGFHSLFIFTFSAPQLAFVEGETPKLLQIGDLIEQVEGGIDEFSGHTQVTFPSFKPLWKDKEKGIVQKVADSELPKPTKIILSDTWNRKNMEPLESALVEVNDAIAIPFDTNQDGWSEFRQWPVLLVKAQNPADQQKCEELVKTELALHVDANKNAQSSYRKCLATCQSTYLDEQSKCSKDDAVCNENATSVWFDCFFGTCRFDNENGLFARFDKAKCDHAILLVISNTTVPGYDPTTKEHLTRRFPYIRGIMMQSRASAFYKIQEVQYDNEQSNNGYVIWVRGPQDLGLPKN